MSRRIQVNTSAQRNLILCSIAVFAALAFALLAPHLCSHNPVLADLSLANKPPCGEYLFGTDSLGRCILCRVLTGLQTTIFAALAVVALSFAIGSVVG